MTEYEQIRRMHYQESLLKRAKVKYKAPWGKWYNAKKVIEQSLVVLGDDEKDLKTALQLSIKALSLKLHIDDNPPLKKIALDSMDGEPVWVVSTNHNGRWGIVNAAVQCIDFVENGAVYQEEWFSGNYLFRFKKTVIDYSSELEQNGIADEGNAI